MGCGEGVGPKHPQVRQHRGLKPGPQTGILTRSASWTFRRVGLSRRERRKDGDAVKRTGFTLIELMGVLAIIRILAAIPIPNFSKFQARPKQGDVKANLKSLFTAQRSHYQESHKYTHTINNHRFGP